MRFEDKYFEGEERCGFLISADMKRAWAAQVEILQEIKNVCEQLNIQYFADWGTLLGAVRHGGFIPWDDDLDIGMLRKDYMLFLQEAPKLLDSWYELKSVYTDPTHDIVKARIINGRKMCFDRPFLKKFHGCPYVVGIDIFPIDNIPDDKEKLEEQLRAIHFLMQVEASIPETGPYDSETLELVREVENVYGIQINYKNNLRHEMKRAVDMVSLWYMHEPCKEVSCMMALEAGWDWYHCDRHWYDSYIDMPFENTTIPVPVGYKGILECNYGNDYMTPKQVGSSHDYPFYKEQIIALKEVMEQEFQTELTVEQMEELIHAKVAEQYSGECTENSEVKIGVIGTGRITERFWDECKCIAGIRVAAIYNRHMESIHWFAEHANISGDDGILLTDDIEAFYGAVDAVYVASPHEYHVSYTMQALQHDKHVICEKPMAVSKRDVEEIFALASAKNLICMEAIKTAYCPGFQKILEIVESGAIGTPRDIDATFTKIGNAAGREMWSEYGGSFVELGSYVLLPVVKLYGTKEKPQVSTFTIAGAPGHDSYTKMMLSYENSVATVKTGLGVKSEGELIIAGDRGYIRVPSPWWLTRHIEVHHENPNQVEVYDIPFEGSGLRYEISEFADRIHSIGEDSDIIPEISDEESIWLADVMEKFRTEQEGKKKASERIPKEKLQQLKIWAHRGCSMAYPENTLLSFKKAAEIKGLTGIELDTQLTSDGEIVVIHDEYVDRTTDGNGRVCDFTLEELRELHITGSGQTERYMLSDDDRAFMGMKSGEILHIPTLREVLETVKPYCERDGLRINIELKNSVIPYEGMEQKVIDMVREYGLSDYIVYSSFNHASLQVVRSIEAEAEIAPLAGDYHDCLDGFKQYDADAIHPWNCGMPVNMDDVIKLETMNIPVRVYNGSEPLYGQCRRLPDMDMREYCWLGMTDMFTNTPEHYLGKTSKK